MTVFNKKGNETVRNIYYIKKRLRGFRSRFSRFSHQSPKIEPFKNYIINQKEHHENRDFKTEFRVFLEHYEMKYDERYVWD